VQRISMPNRGAFLASACHREEGASVRFNQSDMLRATFSLPINVAVIRPVL